MPPTQEAPHGMLLMLDAARGASAAQITAVIPRTTFARSDRRTPRASPSAGGWSPTCSRPPACTGCSR
ncbi:MAG: ribose-phosphate pyrophosphokinase-like domain-containing protein [Nocardioides sp.]